MIKVILFDLDGTLIDSERYYCEGTYEWIKRFGFKGKLEDVYAIIGTTMQETCRIISELIDHKLNPEEVYAYNAEFFAKEKPLVCKDYIFKEVKGVIEMLSAKGYRMAICSSSTVEEVEKAINELGFAEYIEAIYSSHDCLHGKPHPEVYLKALEHFGVSDNEAIVVEDSYSGIMAAKNAKIYTVARKDYRFNIDQSNADVCIDGLDELYEVIKEINYGRCNRN